MNLTEISELIQIRQYVANSIENYNIDRPTVNAMSGTLLLLDKKILNLLLGEQFKKYIHFDEVTKVSEEVARFRDIKNGMNK